MSGWQVYTDTHQQHTVVGQLLQLDSIYSPQLDTSRHLYVWLPPSYDEDGERRFPVLYMHDGDNLFDAFRAPMGEWQVDESLTQLADEGIELIVVGIPNAGDRRFKEYSPYDHPQRGTGLAEPYLRFIVDTIKPRIDTDFRTLAQPTHTGLMGSSMGGLVSLYGFLRYPDTFGLCGAMSPVFWYGEGALLDAIRTLPPQSGRVYLDVGGREGAVYTALADAEVQPETAANTAYVSGVHQLYEGLVDRGYADRASYVEAPEAMHNEAAWAGRFPGAIRFLFASWP